MKKSKRRKKEVETAMDERWEASLREAASMPVSQKRNRPVTA